MNLVPFSVVMVDPSPPLKRGDWEEDFFLCVIVTGTATETDTTTKAAILLKTKNNFLRVFLNPGSLDDRCARSGKGEDTVCAVRLVALLSKCPRRGVLEADVNTFWSGESPVRDCKRPAADRLGVGPSLAVVEASLVKMVGG